MAERIWTDDHVATASRLAASDGGRLDLAEFIEAIGMNPRQRGLASSLGQTLKARGWTMLAQGVYRAPF